MSGTNANCHVSNKWEDTGGSDNPECVATDLLIRDPNDVSLQELIETELALRSSSANKKLICDMEDAKNESNLLILAEKMSSSSAEPPPVVVNGRSKAAVTSTNHRASCNVTVVDDFDVLYNEEVDATNGDELVKVVEEIVTNGHHDLTDHATPDPFDDICQKDGLVVSSTLEESRKDGASDSTTAHSSAVFDSLENSISEATTTDASSPQQQAQIVEPSPNPSVSFESNSSNSNLVVIDNPSTATNIFDNDFVPISEVQIVTEDSAIEAAATVVTESAAAVVQEAAAAVVPESAASVVQEAVVAVVSEAAVAVVPEAQPDPKMSAKPTIKLEVIEFEPPVSHHNGTVSDQDWICVGDATGLHTIVESPSLLEESSEPEFVFEEHQTRNLAEESVRNLVFGEDVAVGETVECSNTNVSCRIIDQQLLDAVSRPESQGTTSNQSTKTDSSCCSSVAELVENVKTTEELLKLCNDDYFGDVARRILEERSRMENGPQHLSETKLIEGCSFGLLNGCVSLEFCFINIFILNSSFFPY